MEAVYKPIFHQQVNKSSTINPNLHSPHKIATTGARNSKSVFRIRDLPPEIREKSFERELEVQVGRQAPPLLLALAADPPLYAEALRIYMKIDFALTARNWQQFRDMPQRQLFRIRQLYVAWERDLREIVPDRWFEENGVPIDSDFPEDVDEEIVGPLKQNNIKTLTVEVLQDEPRHET